MRWKPHSELPPFDKATSCLIAIPPANTPEDFYLGPMLLPRLYTWVDDWFFADDDDSALEYEVFFWISEEELLAEIGKPRPDAAIAILRNGQGLHSEDHVAVRKDALDLVLDYLEGSDG